MPQVNTDAQKTRPFQVRVRVHSRCSRGSDGHGCPGRYTSQAERSRSAPEPTNIHSLCSLNGMSQGTLLVRAATVAPKPKVTSKKGSAQQINVPIEAKSASQLVVVAPPFIMSPLMNILPP